MNMRVRHAPHERVAAMIQTMIGADVAVVAAPAEAYPVGLLPTEAPAVANAVPARRREFTTGRVLARQAMTQLRLPQAAIPQAEDRAPIWPARVTGSISHDATLCVAAVAPRTRFKSFGIDVEANKPLDIDLIDIICTRAELDWLSKQRPSDITTLAKLIFSAKEAAFKCQYPHSGAMLDFHDLDLCFDLVKHQFTARFRTSAPPFKVKDILRGRFAIEADYIITTVALPQRESCV